jgi:hypothetical protein
VNCPQCNGPLKHVPSSSWMSDEQYDAVKAGDYFCTACPSNDRGNEPLCYWNRSEVEAAEANRCAAIMHN